MARRRLIAAMALLPVVAVAQDEPPMTTAEAGHAFDRSCSGCHTVPDDASAFDRAWLDQVNRTA